MNLTVTCVTFDHTKIDDDLSTLIEKNVCEVKQGSPKKGNSSENWYYSRQIYPLKMGLLLKSNCIKQNLVCSFFFKYLIVFWYRYLGKRSIRVPPQERYQKLTSLIFGKSHTQEGIKWLSEDARRVGSVGNFWEFLPKIDIFQGQFTPSW